MAERKRGYTPINAFIHSNSNYTNSLSELKFSAEPEYIEWAIKNIEEFFIDKDDIILLQKSLCHKYVGLTVKFIDNNTYSFTPVYYSHTYLLDELSVKLNESKILKYSTLVKTFTANDKNESQSFERYAGTYAQGVEGWSDEDIDNAFGGEPSAYWNID